MRVAILGGSGRLGAALAARLSRAGHDVVLGSRDAERARGAAASLAGAAGAGPGGLSGDDNRGAAASAPVVFLTVPSAAQVDTLLAVREVLGGRVLVDCTVCLDPSDPARWAPPPEGSAALRAQALAPEARVVSAFHTLSAHAVAAAQETVEGDGLVAGDDAEAKALVMRLGESCGIRCVDAGDLAHAGVIEHLTPLLIGLNKRYRRRSAGVRVIGLT